MGAGGWGEVGGHSGLNPPTNPGRGQPCMHRHAVPPGFSARLGAAQLTACMEVASQQTLQRVPRLPRSPRPCAVLLIFAPRDAPSASPGCRTTPRRPRPRSSSGSRQPRKRRRAPRRPAVQPHELRGAGRMSTVQRSRALEQEGTCSVLADARWNAGWPHSLTAKLCAACQSLSFKQLLPVQVAG